MKNLLFAGIAATSMLAISPALAASDSFASGADNAKTAEIGGVFNGRKGGGAGMLPGMGGPKMGGHMMGPKPGMNGPIMNGPGMGGNHRWGHRVNGRWFVGFQAPGGWGGYRIPQRGFALPTYWVQPSYRIINYPTYGLYAPQTGYGWSRYYDDAVLSDSRGYVQDYRSDVAWDRYEGGYAPGDYAQPEYGPAMGADRGVYYGDDSVYSNSGYQPAPPPPMAQPGGYYQGAPQSGYGQYGAPYPQAQGPAYQSRQGFERYERCLKDRGLTGGAIGAVVGAVIGNRVAGKGDRLGGSLLGGGLGALAGLGIEKATNKCKKHLPREDYYYGAGQQGGGYPGQTYPGQGYPNGTAYPGGQGGYMPPHAPQPYPYPPQGGYYQNGWYYPAPVITTVTVMPSVVTTTTVSEEVYYETVKVPQKKRYVKKWKPKPKPRCGCR